jgi:hypothetical protein
VPGLGQLLTLGCGRDLLQVLLGLAAQTVISLAVNDLGQRNIIFVTYEGS